MEEKKYIKIRLSTVILLLIILILLIIIALGGVYIFQNKNENEIKNEETQQEMNNESLQSKPISQIQPKITKDENGNVKTILADFNNDGIAETAEFYYTYENSGSEPSEKYISKIYTNLITENENINYTKDFEEEMFYDINIELVDINTQDNYKEIKVSFVPTDASSQYYFNYFLKYDGYDYDFIKINRNNSEYLMYEEEKNADYYIISAIEDNENKLRIENNQIKAYSIIDQEETFDLKENGQLLLTNSKFVGYKEMYTQYFTDWGPGAVYSQKDLNSTVTVYGSIYEEGLDNIIPTETFEVIEVEDHWIQVKVNNNIGYISYKNVYNEPSI